MFVDSAREWSSFNYPEAFSLIKLWEISATILWVLEWFRKLVGTLDLSIFFTLSSVQYNEYNTEEKGLRHLTHLPYDYEPRLEMKAHESLELLLKQ